MLAGIEAPGVRSELSLQGTLDLIEIIRIHGRIDSLTAFVISDGMTHLIVHDLIVVAADHLTCEEEVFLPACGLATKAL